MDDLTTMSENDHVRRMFIGKLPPGIAEQEVKLFLEDACGGGPGSVENVSIKSSKTGEGDPYTFGFIAFSTSDYLEEVLLKRPSLALKGRKLEVRHSIPSRAEEIPGADIKTNKLFVTGLPKDCDPAEVKECIAEELRARFGTRYGSVDLVEVATPKGEAGRTKGFGFITLSSEDFADRLVVGHSRIRLMGLEMRLKKSEPHEKANGPPAHSTNQNGPPAHSTNQARGILTPPSADVFQGDRLAPPQSQEYDDRRHEAERAEYILELRAWMEDRRARDDDVYYRRLDEFKRQRVADDDLGPPPPPRPLLANKGYDGYDGAPPREKGYNGYDGAPPREKRGDDRYETTPIADHRPSERPPSRGSRGGGGGGGRGARGGRGAGRGNRFEPYSR